MSNCTSVSSASPGCWACSATNALTPPSASVRMDSIDPLRSTTSVMSVRSDLMEYLVFSVGRVFHALSVNGVSLSQTNVPK